MPAAAAAAKNWRRSSVTSDRDRILSEFIDAWNAGRRPDVDDYVSRVPAEERAELADELLSFLSFAPTPELQRRRPRRDPRRADRGRGARRVRRARRAAARAAAPPARAVLAHDGAAGRRAGRELGLPGDREAKTAGYLERLERRRARAGARLAPRVRRARPRAAGPARRARGRRRPQRLGPGHGARVPRRRGRGGRVRRHLDVLADALEAPGGEGRDEVDDLFLGGR